MAVSSLIPGGAGNGYGGTAMPAKKLDLSEHQRQQLTVACSEILASLEKIAAKASEGMQAPMPGDAAMTLAAPGNPMTGRAQDAANIDAARYGVRESLRRILVEPFTVRVVVRWENGVVETYHITKASASALSGRLSDLKLATYASPKGRISEFPAGSSSSIIVHGDELQFEIVERTLLRPTKVEGWDAVGEKFEYESWNAALESMRRFVEIGGTLDEGLDILAQIRAEGEGIALAQKALSRRVVERMELRDQPALDRYQGEIFRMPLENQVFLLGPPGSGKTTTLIQRLSAKRNPDGLTEEEMETLIQTGLNTRFREPDAWVMFSPTELLQLYLRDAFNRELVPAGTNNLRTWERERRGLARNVYGILRASIESPGFELDDKMQSIRGQSSSSISAVHDKFVNYYEKTIVDRVAQSFDVLSRVDDALAREAALRTRTKISSSSTLEVQDIVKLLNEAEELKSVIERLRKETSGAVDQLVDRMIRKHRELLDEVITALPDLRAPAREDEEDDEDDESEDIDAARSKSPKLLATETIIFSLRRRARLLAQGRKSLSGRAAKIISLLGTRAPSDDELLQIGKNLVTMAELRIVVGAPRRTVLGLPALYRRFRSTQGEFFVDQLDRGKISAAECDILLLAALRAARRIFVHDRRKLQDPVVPSWLESIRQRYIIQVFVDEATDFSAVQLACMLELAHPELRSWFACGDFRQRITLHGIQDASELPWIAKCTDIQEIVSRDISIGYRQSHQLRLLTRALENRTALEDESTKDLDDDVSPLLVENLHGAELGEWISERIYEVEQTVGRLPSIAVFVDGDQEIDPLVRSVGTKLAPHNIAIVGCKEGRVVGDRQEVRVFDVRQIKGLEFEAVFFVSIDKLHRSMPLLFERFLYVGMTRAATYLAITCEGVLPEPLERVRSRFSTRSWKK